MNECRLGTAHTDEQEAKNCNIGSMPECCETRLDLIVSDHSDSWTREQARLEIQSRH